MNAKSADLSRSAWSGAATRDFTDIDVAPRMRRTRPTSRMGDAHDRVCPPVRYETILPPAALADLLIYMYWSVWRT